MTLSPMGYGGTGGVAPSGYGGSTQGSGIDRVTQALMQVKQPPPVPPAAQMPAQSTVQPLPQQMGAQPQVPLGAPAMTSPVPGGGMTGAGPMPNAAQPMGGAPMPMTPQMPMMPGGQPKY